MGRYNTNLKNDSCNDMKNDSCNGEGLKITSHCEATTKFRVMVNPLEQGEEAKDCKPVKFCGGSELSAFQNLQKWFCVHRCFVLTSGLLVL
jgi:hypothetical protein